MRNESYILERQARVLGLWMRLRAALRAGEPCRAPPGSSEKLAAIHARAEAGRELWHPRDGFEG